MSNNIQTIVEGAMPDTPSRLMYCSLELRIPENALILAYKNDERFKWLLYAKAEDFQNMKILNNPDFSSFGRVKAYGEIEKKFKGGFPLDILDPGIRWAFDAQRSFTTRDGRIYVQTTFFHPDWTWYLDAVPIILEDCRKIFSEELTDWHLNEHPKRAF